MTKEQTLQYAAVAAINAKLRVTNAQAALDAARAEHDGAVAVWGLLLQAHPLETAVIAAALPQLT